MRKFVLVKYEDHKKKSTRGMDAGTKNLQSILNSHTLDPSTRNDLYDQNLHEMINEKRENAKRLQRVEVVRERSPQPQKKPDDYTIRVVQRGETRTPSPPPRYVPPLPPPPPPPVVPKRTPPIVPTRTPSTPIVPYTTSPSTDDIEEPMDEDGNEEEEEEKGEDEEEEDNEDEEEGEASEDNITPPPPPPQTKQTKPITIVTSSSKASSSTTSLSPFEQIYNIVMKTPRVYGLTQDGQVINPTTMNVYRGTKPGDARIIIRQLIGLDSEIQNPVGKKTLKSRLMNDLEIRKLIDSATSTNGAQTGKGGFVFKPKLWRRL